MLYNNCIHVPDCMLIILSGLPSTGVHLAMVYRLHGNSWYTTVMTYLCVAHLLTMIMKAENIDINSKKIERD